MRSEKKKNFNAKQHINLMSCNPENSFRFTPNYLVDFFHFARSSTFDSFASSYTFFFLVSFLEKMRKPEIIAKRLFPFSANSRISKQESFIFVKRTISYVSHAETNRSSVLSQKVADAMTDKHIIAVVARSTIKPIEGRLFPFSSQRFDRFSLSCPSSAGWPLI